MDFPLPPFWPATVSTDISRFLSKQTSKRSYRRGPEASRLRPVVGSDFAFERSNAWTFEPRIHGRRYQSCGPGQGLGCPARMADRRSICAIQCDGWPLTQSTGQGRGAGSSLCSARWPFGLQPEASLGGSYAVALERYGIGAERLAGVLGVVRSFSGATATGMARVAWCSFCNSIAHTQTAVCRSGRRSKATVARASTPQKGRGLWAGGDPMSNSCGTWLAMRSARHLLTTP